MVVSSFIRAYHLKEIGEWPASLALRATEAQNSARNKLYLAFTSGQDISDTNLANMVHNLCDSILCAEVPPEIVFGPVEFAFCLYLKQKDGKYRSINHLTAFFAAVQWCLRIILIHKIRLQDMKSDLYIPYIPSAPLSASGTPFASGGGGSFSSNQVVAQESYEGEIEEYLNYSSDEDNFEETIPGYQGSDENERDSILLSDIVSITGDRVSHQDTGGLLQ